MDRVPGRSATAGSAQCRRDRLRQHRRSAADLRAGGRRALVYVAYEPPAPKGEAILVPKDSKLQSVADLKGKKVALNKGSNVHYLLVKALEKAGVRYSEIEPVFLPPADARAAFERGAVDAWVIWDPFQAAAEAATPGAHAGGRQQDRLQPPVLFLVANSSWRPIRRSSISCWLSSARSMPGPRATSKAVAEQLAPASASRPCPGSRAEAAVLRDQADHRERDRRAAADRRHLLQAGPDPQADQISGRGPEVLGMSTVRQPRPTSSGSCRPTATAAISAPPTARAT